MTWTLGEEFETPGGMVRWKVLGSGDPVVLVHGTPYSSFLWRDIAPALARTRTVHVFDHLGFGQSDQREGQDLSLAAHARNLARLLDRWELSSPSVIAHDIGGAVALRTLLLEKRNYRDLALFDAVSGGEGERGLFRLVLEHSEFVRQLPGYTHEALVAGHMRHNDAHRLPARRPRRVSRTMAGGRGAGRAPINRPDLRSSPHEGPATDDRSVAAPGSTVGSPHGVRS
ncbi:alpha/beta fold hydrolase [Streptomyces sp. NPDC046332]|uniref:alpha/beta fold hydrolase n=1 Tax=Streptomyces sp. NPDC046332 TaxID=3155133 RepID=UPI0033CDF687